jgi:hypothetical protein
MSSAQLVLLFGEKDFPMIGFRVNALFLCIFPFLALAAMAFWIWMIIDCAINEPSQENDKVVWMLVIILTNWIGALIYFFVRRPARIRLFGH